MIARLRGPLVEKGAGAVIVECAGVGYDVHVSSTTLAQLPDPGAEVTLRIHTAAAENKITLYGFATTAERALFDLLITVKNVGPSTACGILSGATPEALTRTIAAGDVPALTKLRGVGKKTAELLVVELRERCEVLIATWDAGSVGASRVSAPSGGRSPILDDVTSALVHLGWRQAEAEKAIARLDIPPGATVEGLLREALRGMAR